MEPMLASALHNQWPWVKEVFASGFRSAPQWSAYIDTHFGATKPSVLTVLDKTAAWSAEDFQALYVACWIVQPVEKGTFMIKLTPPQRANARAGYETLGKRWTSHLHKHGRSAAEGWKFLKGYHELLVQMEGGGKHSAEAKPHLFLKCEGHTAFDIRHLKSYYTKARTGKGDVANARLQELARKKEELGLGIAERAAENYSNEYKALLRHLGFSGKTTTVHDAVGRLFGRCTALAASHDARRAALHTHLKAAHFPVQADTVYAAKLNNADLASLLQAVVLPFIDFLANERPPVTVARALVDAVIPARPDFVDIATRLRTDAAMTLDMNTQRYFNEIVLEPSIIDAGLDAARILLR
jgi:hypothetical protein